MADYYFYCKLKLDRAFFDAMKHGNLREKCKMILLVAMNDKNIVRPRLSIDQKTKKPRRAKLVQSIAALTETTERSIELQLKQLDKSGFGQWDKKNNAFVVHKEYARKGNRKNPPEYDGLNPQYSDEEQGVLAQLWTMFESRAMVRDTRKKDMNKAMLKKMDVMTEAILQMCSLMKTVVEKTDDKDTREKIQKEIQRANLILVSNNN